MHMTLGLSTKTFIRLIRKVNMKTTSVKDLRRLRWIYVGPYQPTRGLRKFRSYVGTQTSRNEDPSKQVWVMYYERRSV